MLSPQAQKRHATTMCHLETLGGCRSRVPAGESFLWFLIRQRSHAPGLCPRGRRPQRLAHRERVTVYSPSAAYPWEREQQRPHPKRATDREPNAESFRSLPRSPCRRSLFQVANRVAVGPNRSLFRIPGRRHPAGNSLSAFFHHCETAFVFRKIVRPTFYARGAHEPFLY